MEALYKNKVMVRLGLGYCLLATINIFILIVDTLKHSKIDKTKVFMTNDSLMKVKSFAECSPWSILQYF